MTKELIISANVHEKKVSIIEDGVVTEFYVERRDENQGVVGNLYKGRVMKVLPGMQSAFVDIGLERDAFLYVSDFTEFMEEEEEIDFKETGDEARIPPPRDDRSRRPDRQRPPMGAPVYQRTPERVAEEKTAEGQVAFEDVVEQLAEIADESVIPPPPSDEEMDVEAARVAAGGGELEVAEAEVDLVGDPAEAEVDLVGEPAANEIVPVEAEALPEEEDRPRRGRGRRSTAKDRAAAKTEKEAEEVPPPSAEPAKRKGKAPARRGTRRRGEEPGEEETPVVAAEAESPFQRVTDEDIERDTGEMLKDAIIQEKIVEKVHEAEYRTPSSPPPEREPEPEWRVGSFRSQLDEDAGFQRVIDEANESAARASEPIVEAAPEYLEPPPAANEAEDRPVSAFRHIADLLPRGLFRRSQAEVPQVPLEAIPVERGDEPVEAKESIFDDAEASIRDRGERAEFAVRRGGRGRRRRPRDPNQGPAGAPAPVADEERTGEAGAETAELSSPEPIPEAEVIAVEPRPVEPKPPIDQRPRDPMRGGQRRPEGRFERRPDPRRPEPPLSRRPDRVGPATISELLHEGQEILVQIAKEPIAKKGARITSHIALPGRLLVYMPTVNHIGVSRKIASEIERVRLKRTVIALRDKESASGGFIARTACAGHSEQELHDDMRYLIRTWADVRKKAERVKSPSLVHRDLDLVQRILRDQLSDEYSSIRVDNEVEYARIVEFVNRVQPKLVNRVKLYTGNQPILEKFGVQPEIDKAVKPRVWLRSGGYIVINQTEALVAIDVNTGKFVGKSDRLEDTITRTNLEAAKEIVRQVRLRDLGGIIVIDFIDMEERKNRQRVMMALQQELQTDRAPSKILSINDFGLVAITRKRVKQSLERTLCTPCPYCQGAGMVKSPQTMCFEILEQAKAMSRQMSGSDVMLRVSPDVAEAFHTKEGAVLEEIEAYFGTPVTIEADPHLHQEQYDFAIM
jgi:ribonuclease G